MNSLRQDFLNQSIETVDNLIARLTDEKESGNLSETFRREAFRALHTIKGTAQTFGFSVSGRLAHELENLLSTEKNQQNSPAAGDYKSIFQDGLQFLKQTFGADGFEIPAAFTEKIHRRKSLENASESFLSEVPAEIVAQLSSREKNIVASALQAGKNLFCFEVIFDLADFAEGLTEFREALIETGEIVATLPAAAKSDHINKIGFRILLTTAENPENIRQIASSRLAEIVFQTARKNFSNDLSGALEQAVQHGENLARQLGKNVRFEIAIEESVEKSEITPRNLKLIFDALLHLIRNAIDHAVESRKERAASGKNVDATIKIEFSNGANDFRLRVGDDGRGIDLEKIKARAIEKKLIGDGENLTEQRLFDLIFTLEFSTAERLTEISGRGVGLDAVRDSIEKAGGKITVGSRKGTGATFEIILPNKESRDG